MKALLLFLVLFLTILSLPTELNLPVRPDTQEKLGFSLQRLAQELDFFRTPFENRINLYKRVTQAEHYLQEVTSQVGDYENVIRGRANKVAGRNNVIVGSFNTLRGSNNYVFIEKYTGQANGDLLIGRWRIEIEKKTLILVNSGLAISFINEETNRRYLRYLTGSRKFSLGSNLGENTVTLVRDEGDSDSSGFSYGSSINRMPSPNMNTEQTIKGNSSQETTVRTMPLTTPQTVSSMNPLQVANVLSTRQSVVNSNQQTAQTNLLARLSQQSLTNLNNRLTNQNPTRRRGSMEQAIEARSLALSAAQRVMEAQPLSNIRQLGSGGQLTDVLSSNRLQTRPSSESNLRIVQQSPSVPQSLLQTESQLNGNGETRSLIPPPNQRISLGARIIKPLSLNSAPSTETSTQQPILIPSPASRSFPTQFPINLASWRNRS